MPEMSEENYQAILTAIDELRQENEKTKKTLADMVSMNKALLNSKGSQQVSSQDTGVRKKELNERLKKEYDRK